MTRAAVKLAHALVAHLVAEGHVPSGKVKYEAMKGERPEHDGDWVHIRVRRWVRVKGIPLLPYWHKIAMLDGTIHGPHKSALMVFVFDEDLWLKCEEFVCDELDWLGAEELRVRYEPKTRDTYQDMKSRDRNIAISAAA